MDTGPQHRGLARDAVSYRGNGRVHGSQAFARLAVPMTKAQQLRSASAQQDGHFKWTQPPPTLLGRLGGWFAKSEPSVTPTVFHITHPKAGSQWIHRMFHALAYDRIVMPEVREAVNNIQFLERPIQSGKLYPTLYVSREEFEGVAIPGPWRRFVVIRDLRDTLISAYFSIKLTHAMSDAYNLGLRRQLRETSTEDGLLMLLDEWVPRYAAMQMSWLDAPDDLLKYEDLLRDDCAMLERVLIGHCRLDVTPERLREIVLANRFQAFSGRSPGTEDLSSHERKGIAGDWKNHFTPKLKAAFKDRFGDMLIATGYEKDTRW